MRKILPALLLFFLFSCRRDLTGDSTTNQSFQKIGAVTVPAGYERIPVQPGSFGEWLRANALRKDNHVYLYNGQLKNDQTVQFAVLDLPIGNKNLQQCADVVMRLRADYLFSQKRYNEIEFTDNDHKAYRWRGGQNHAGFDSYLENVFARCGTASLEKQLHSVAIKDMQPGDVWIKGGYPGHAMLVADMAINKKGGKIFMLVQGYMPAQDIHIVKNPLDEKLSPWYSIDDGNNIITPGWIFKTNQLRTW